MFEGLQPHQQILKPEGPTVKETIAVALAIPFIIVTTWFGITAVNNFSEDWQWEIKRQAITEQRDDEQDRRMACYQHYKDITPDVVAFCSRL